MYRLRGHHLLCLLGYRGMGYSEEYVANMTQLHQTIRSRPDTEIQLIVGADDLCDKFPANEPCHCQDANVYQRDAEVLKQLGLEARQIWPWQTLLQQIAQSMEPSDIPRLCGTCPWLSYGVCEDGVKHVKSGAGLYPVEPQKS